MNLSYEDMNNQHDMDTYTKQIENPKISFEEYINGFNPNPNPNPNPKGMEGWRDGMEGWAGGMKGGTLLHSTPLHSTPLHSTPLHLTLTLATHPTLWEMMISLVPSLDTLIPIRQPHLIV